MIIFVQQNKFENVMNETATILSRSTNVELKSWSHIKRTLCTSRPRQNGRHFAENILKWIFLNENVLISITIRLKFIPDVC